MTIRNEREADIKAISDVTIAAFADQPYSRQTEHFIIDALRAADAMAISLVAEIDGAVVGHIAFSPVTIAGNDCDWYGMGPVSVLPELQRQGIGSALVNEGLRLLKDMGGKGCVLVGDPNYYTRFGFRNLPELTLDGVPPEVFMGLPLGEDIPSGAVMFHEAFTAEE
jgi:putative acetyltransferase